MVKTPDERALPNITSEDWATVKDNRKYVYARLKAFGERVLGRQVFWTGPLGQHQWVVPGGAAYRQDPSTLMENLEYRALEAAAEAAHEYDATKGISLESFMAVVIDRKLQSEFDNLVRGGTEAIVIPLDDVPPDELSYLDLHDSEPDDGLDDETRERLQAAMGALSSREAWALRMVADGSEPGAIAEALGLKGEKSVYKIISKAKRKARAVYDA